MAVLLLFALLFILLTISIPIGIALGIATMITMLLTSNTPILLIAQNAFASLDSFPLMAIPFFMLAGSLMGSAGISKRLLKLSDALIGAITGGLAMVTTVSCMFFAAISGSGPATVSAIGSFMIPEMKEQGYSEGFAASITASAGSLGVIIPPSIPFVIYGVVSGASVGEMFMAGIIPGILLGIGIMGTAYVISKKRGYKGNVQKATKGELIHSLKDAIWALLVPIIILGGIYGGIFTPTEAAVVAVVYSLIIGKFVYKELDFKKTYNSFKDAVLINGATTFMIGLSMSFASYLTMEQIPTKLAQTLLSITDNRIVILIVINLFLLVVGCFVDNISSMIILTPIFLPVVVRLGIDPVHFGLFMTIALAIGFVTPPYGANLFVASAVSGVKMEKISKNMIPFILTFIVLLFLFTFIPQFSMLLPSLLR